METERIAARDPRMSSLDILVRMDADAWWGNLGLLVLTAFGAVLLIGISVWKARQEGRRINVVADIVVYFGPPLVVATRMVPMPRMVPMLPMARDLAIGLVVAIYIILGARRLARTPRGPDDRALTVPVPDDKQG